MRSKLKNYTFSIQEELVNELKSLVAEDKSKSFNFIVREALAQYVSKLKEETYEKEMKEAASDPDFIRNNEKTMEDFKFSDAQTSEMIEEW
ncbi:MAG: hypothetical protein PHR39_04185 [Actinomycetota bacterium]|nr:hypothetical protein [Actinomycetota bacterium]